MRLHLTLIMFLSMLAVSCGRHSGEQAVFAAELSQLEELAWQARIKDSLELRYKLGLAIEKMPDISEAKYERDAAFFAELGQRLKEIPIDRLEGETWLSGLVLEQEIRNAQDALTHFWMPFMGTPYTEPSLTGVHDAMAIYPLISEGDRDRFVSLLEDYQTLIVQLHARFETQANRGVVMPGVQIDPVIAMYHAFLSEDLDSGPFHISGNRLQGLDDETLDEFEARVREIIMDKINPAINGLIDYLDGPYRQQAPEAVGCSQYPGGADYYRFLVKHHTTMDISPEEVHLKGQMAVADLEQRIASLMDRLDYSCTRAELREELNKDPRFFVDSPEKVGERLMGYITRLEPRVNEFFSATPKAPYGVARLSPSLEESMTFGFYQWPGVNNARGTYFYNGSKLEERSLLGAESLIYHELVPGHHFQLATVVESTVLSPFRKMTFHTAFSEGWAEYASGLGREMGGYQDPYDDLGRCFSEMFFAVRLVVDTGMNAMGWSREKAMDYMRTHLLESETQIRSESLRYSVLIPGQALAYRMGAERIRELRKQAESQLGDRFDVRRFHALLLENGSLPMTVLEKNVQRFIKSGG